LRFASNPKPGLKAQFFGLEAASVMPATAGIQKISKTLDSCVRGNDLSIGRAIQTEATML
jgi:hypothetical protein